MRRLGYVNFLVQEGLVDFTRETSQTISQDGLDTNGSFKCTKIQSLLPINDKAA